MGFGARHDGLQIRSKLRERGRERDRVWKAGKVRGRIPDYAAGPGKLPAGLPAGKAHEETRGRLNTCMAL